MEIFTQRMSAPKLTSRVAWGAVFAGALAALGFFFALESLIPLLEILFDIRNSAFIASANFCVLIAAMFVGGAVTSKIAEGETQTHATLHGLLVWSLLIIATLALASNTDSVFESELISRDFHIEGVYASIFIATLGFLAVSFSLVAAILGAKCAVQKPEHSKILQE